MARVPSSLQLPTHTDPPILPNTSVMSIAFDKDSNTTVLRLPACLPACLRLYAHLQMSLTEARPRALAPGPGIGPSWRVAILRW